MEEEVDGGFDGLAAGLLAEQTGGPGGACPAGAVEEGAGGGEDVDVAAQVVICPAIQPAFYRLFGL